MTLKVIYRGALSPFSGYGNDGIDLVRALMACGADVYLHPTHVDAPLPEDVAHLLTKPLKAPFDLFLHHADPGGLGLTPEQARSAKVTVAWTMWESSSLDNLKGRTNLARKLDSYDVLLSYDEVCDEAFAPHTTRKDSPARGVLQGGFDPSAWKYVERDWYGDRFAFAQPLTAQVHTPTGFVPLGDLHAGSVITDPRGGTQTVTEVFPRGELQSYRVTFKDGSSTMCSADHLWRVKCYGSQQWEVLSTTDLAESGLRDRSTWRWEVPATLPVPGESDLPLDPYLLGALLGDGTLSSRHSGVSLVSADPELVEECVARVPASVGVTEWEDSGYFRVRFKGIMPALASLGLMGATSHTKFVPDLYLSAGPEQRRLLLQGLMDTDGAVNTTGTPCFVSASKSLAEAVTFLARSLGGSASLKTYPGLKAPYIVHLSGLDTPFLLARKQSGVLARKRPLRRAVVSIEPLEESVEMRCISVSGRDRTYVTDDFVVTHNCMVGQLHERKDPFLAIQAFQELKEEKGPFFEGAELHLKAQPLDSGVLTVNGWKAMGDLQVGDLLVDPVSGSQKVEGVYPQGVQDVYRVTLSDGSSAECTLDHLWRVKLESGRWQVKTLSEILESGLRRGEHIRWEVPTVVPVAFAPQAELVWDPYFLGLLLGDGSLTQQVKFGSADPELLEACLAALPSGVSPGSRSFRTNTEWITLCGAQDVARDLGIFDKRAWEKFVPVPYLRGTPEERLALLQGLMDTDGTSATANSAPVFCTTSERLARDVQELVRSLGGNAPLHVVDQTSYTYKGETLSGRTAYQVRVILDRNPFRLRRKAEQWDSVSRKHLIRRRIVGVEKVRTAECQCIKVSGEEQVYVTDDYVVTHNTNIRTLHPAMEETVPKLRIHYDVWPKEVLRQFYASQHVLLAPSRGEGKNLPALEFQTTGGAVIATDWGGMRSWLSPTYAYPLDYTLAPVSPGLPNCLQARASKEHLKALMYEVYSVRPKVKAKAELAAKIIPDMMSWDRVVERLFRVVAERLPQDRAHGLTTRYHLAQGGR